MLIELGVETWIIRPIDITRMSIFDLNKIDAVIIGGGPQTVKGNKELEPVRDLLKCLLIPTLCICAGHQLLADTFGGEIGPARKPEFGPISVIKRGESRLFEGMDSSFDAWSSHNDEITKLPTGFNTIAESKDCPIEAIENPTTDMFGIQFHPEVSHTPKGIEIFKNFIKVAKI